MKKIFVKNVVVTKTQLVKEDNLKGNSVHLLPIDLNHMKMMEAWVKAIFNWTAASRETWTLTENSSDKCPLFLY